MPQQPSPGKDVESYLTGQNKVCSYAEAPGAAYRSKVGVCALWCQAACFQACMSDKHMPC